MSQMRWKIKSPIKDFSFFLFYFFFISDLTTGVFFLIFCNITRLYITQPRRTRDYIMWGIRECWLLTVLRGDLGRLKCFQFYKADSSGVWVFCVCKDNNNYQAILVCLSIKLANFCLLTGHRTFTSLYSAARSMILYQKETFLHYACLDRSDWFCFRHQRSSDVCEAMLCWHQALPYLASKSDVNLANLTVISNVSV